MKRVKDTQLPDWAVPVDCETAVEATDYFNMEFEYRHFMLEDSRTMYLIVSDFCEWFQGIFMDVDWADGDFLEELWKHGAIVMRCIDIEPLWPDNRAYGDTLFHLLARHPRDGALTSKL